MSHTIYFKSYDRRDPRLGRNVFHDSRSLDYQVEPAPLDTLVSIRHERYIPILDQGQLGDCVPNAGIGNLGSGSFWDTVAPLNLLSATDANVDEQAAILYYSKVTAVDPFAGQYPPDDTGSNGLSLAKVFQADGLISGYEHATSLEATLTALSKQPVIIGIEWLANMFEPAPDGHMDVSGNVEGGHELALTELDVENRRVWFDNSWTVQWGVNGRAYFTWDQLGELLAADGDCTVFTVNTAPAPQPAPAPVVEDPKTVFQRRVRRAANQFVQAVTPA